MSFLLALILGPPLEAVAGLSGLFAMTSLLALAAIAMLWLRVPSPVRSGGRAGARAGDVLAMLADRRLWVLNGSVFFLHALLTASFVGLPILLVDSLHLPVGRHWALYLPVMVVAALVMGALLPRMRDDARAARMVVGAVVAIGLALAGMAAAGTSVVSLGIAATVFVAAFNLLEAALPSLVSRLAPASLRGAAMGAYATSQFFGAFVGGAIGGIALGRLGPHGVFAASAAITLVWLPLALWGARRVVAVDGVGSAA
jgi:predicted MFS family arabinose efflux permease